ncbi:MAG: ATP-binding protein [Bacteroidota bacterium]|nr:ATP-binding protein [Bacteroidota bacterium]
MDSNSFIIDNLLQQAGNESIELRASAKLEVIAKEITSFINGHGGDMILGVDDNKNIIGIENAKQYAIDIQTYLSENIVPVAPISVLPILYKHKELILISVWEGAKKPYSYKQVIYNRVGNNTGIAKNKEIVSLIENRKKADFNWERMPVLGAEFDDLDIYEIQRTIELVKKRDPQHTFTDEEDFLIQQGLILNGNITNSCIVLFGKSPTRFIPQSKIRLTVYPDKSATNTFLEDRFFEGNIFSNITSIFTYLDALYAKIIKIEGIHRTEKKNYPEIALREGILNAIIHRDYKSANGFMQISIFSDRTEISNFGSLPEGITVADLKKEHPSILRNPDIANICFIRQYIEMVGSGIIRILSECKKNGFKAPKWFDKNNVLSLIFSGVSHHVNENVKEGKTSKYEGINEGIIVNIEGINESIKGVLEQILSYINKNPMLKTSDIEVFINKSNATTERYLKILKENKYIEYIGSNKTGGYKILGKK